jgi:hypothetical protein
VLKILAESGCEVEFAKERYRPALKAAAGLILEPISAVRKKRLYGTWALYGFETVIWVRRL